MDALKDFLAGYERWLLAFHVIAVISWMAGMLYLPRLFVYHTETAPGSDGSERFKRMETKLLKVIINPAMIAAWVLGLTLAWVIDAHLQGWFQAKFVLVIILWACTATMCGCGAPSVRTATRTAPGISGS